MKNLLLFALILFTTITYAQDKQTKSKELYASALKSYKNNQYESAINLINKAIKTGGGTNKYLETLKVNCYIGQKDWKNAKVRADILFKSLPKDKVLKTLTLNQNQINIRYENKLKKEEQDKIEVIKNKFKKIEYQSEILSELDNLPNLKEGYAYLVNVPKTTTTSAEKNIFIYYGDKYIILTIPSIKVFKDIINITKDKVIYKPKEETPSGNSSIIKICNVNDSCVVVKIIKRRKIGIKRGKAYDDSYYKLFGNGYMGISDRDYSVTVIGAYYYSIRGSSLEGLLTYFDDYGYEKSAAFDVNINDLYKYIYHPYIQTGKLLKHVNYNYVTNKDLKEKLQKSGFKNTKSTKKYFSSNIYHSRYNNYIIYPYRTIELSNKRIKVKAVINNKTYRSFLSPFKDISPVQYRKSRVFKNKKKHTETISLKNLEFTPIGDFSVIRKSDFERLYTTFEKAGKQIEIYHMILLTRILTGVNLIDVKDFN